VPSISIQRNSQGRSSGPLRLIRHGISPCAGHVAHTSTSGLLRRGMTSSADCMDAAPAGSFSAGRAPRNPARRMPVGFGSHSSRPSALVCGVVPSSASAALIACGVPPAHLRLGRQAWRTSQGLGEPQKLSVHRRQQNFTQKKE
jgi:hypothetical protein